jgi:hypothetical protein
MFGRVRQVRTAGRKRVRIVVAGQPFAWRFDSGVAGSIGIRHLARESGDPEADADRQRGRDDRHRHGG